MVSLTLRHLRRDDFNEPLSILKAAFRLFGSRCKRIWEKLGVAGEAKALEVLVGRHGPHYHYHVALIYKPPEKFDSLDTEALHHTLNTIVRNLREMWTRCVLDSGGEVNGFGFDWRQDTPLSYLAKELAAEDTKRRQGLTLIQLLNRFENGEFRAGQNHLDGMDALSGTHRWQLGDLPKKWD